MSDSREPWFPPPLGCVGVVALAGAAVGVLALQEHIDCSPSGCSANYGRDTAIAFAIIGVLAIGILFGMRGALVRSPARTLLWIAIAMAAAKLLMLGARAAYIWG